jgi:hypothetical protein
MAIEELVAFIPPPAHPIDGDGDWSAVERELGFVFPTDFKHLIWLYGSGAFYGSLFVANPLTAGGRAWIRRHSERCRALRDACEEVCPLPPDSPGLLPWGSDSNGHRYCWLASGPPDTWEVVQIFHGYEDEIDPVPGPVTSFLVRFMSNEYPNMLGGNPFTEADRTFGPVP